MKTVRVHEVMGGVKSEGGEENRKVLSCQCSQYWSLHMIRYD